MSEPVKYGSHPQIPLEAICEACGKGRPVTDHCHEHGWVRARVCRHCNALLGLIDRRITPKVESVLLAVLVALRNRCPECDGLGVSDLSPALEDVMGARLPTDLHEWLRREAFELREPMNAIVVAALEERRARSGARGRWVYHKDGDPRNSDPANLEIRESER